jgi:nondiscriminating glutamyl-tRNA synthetase
MTVTGPIRTRFAPSPTGALHLGNVRTAVFNWLLARKTGGAFVLRLEDTDVQRNVQGAEEALMEDLAWLGLHWDEGPDLGGPHAPYRQSERGELHAQAGRRGVEEGWAYPCFCNDQDLAADEVALDGGGRFNRYPGRCRALSTEEGRARVERGEPHLLRFRVPHGDVEIRDEVRGHITFPGNDLDDFVILRRDGVATYNFAVVVDDLAMRITDVIRGAGHLSNTPKQVLIYRALGQDAPRFTHLPTVLGPDRKKLSKRTGAAAVAELRAAGFHHDAVINYLSLLGWSDPQGREVLTRDELIRAVGLDRVGASDTVFDPDKLRWLSQQHFSLMSPDDFTRAALPFVDMARFPQRAERLDAALRALQSRVALLSEVSDFLPLVFPEDRERLLAVRSALVRDPDAVRVIEGVVSGLGALERWEPQEIGAAIRSAGKGLGVKGPALFHPVRLALNGHESGPDLGWVMVAIGREEVLAAYEETLGLAEL